MDTECSIFVTQGFLCWFKWPKGNPGPKSLMSFKWIGMTAIANDTKKQLCKKCQPRHGYVDNSECFLRQIVTIQLHYWAYNNFF